MASDNDSPWARFLAGLKFWLIVIVLCVVVGGVAFFFGRDYVGAHLHEMEVKQRAPDIEPHRSQAPAPQGEDAADDPPIKPVITMSEREPTGREERQARRELAQPQDGAQLHAAEEVEDQEQSEDGDDAEAPAEDDETEGAAEQPAERADEDQFVVTAGSFTQQENADRQVQRLAEHGYQPYITTVEKHGVTYHRVNVGVFDSRDSAQELEGRLESQGFDAIVGTGQE